MNEIRSKYVDSNTGTCCPFPSNTPPFRASALTWILLLASVLALSASSWAKEEAVVETTICEIVTDNAKFEGRLVSVFATVSVDYHSRALIDQGCLMYLRILSGDGQSADVKRLDRALARIWSQPVSVTGKFIGRVIVHPGDKDHPLEDMPATILELHDLRELVIKRID